MNWPRHAVLSGLRGASRAGLVLLVTAGLSACMTARAGAPTPEEQAAHRAVVERFMGKRPQTLAEVTARFAGRTRVLHSSDHGTQVSYLAPDGTVHLWYPGNAKVLHGQWRIVWPERITNPSRVAPNICFQYGADTYNPATRQSGGRWSCAPSGFAIATLRDFAEGDPFALASRDAVPFVLSRDPTTVAELKKKLSGS